MLADTLRRDGHVRVQGALTRSFCEGVVADALVRAGISEADPATWEDRPAHLPVTESWSFDEVAPRAHTVMGDLVGGHEAVAFSGVQDNLIVNFPAPADRWWPPSAGDPALAGWHKDGDWFRHFLDSPEQGLLVIVFWRDVEERQGPTYVAVDSIAPVARVLADHPEGMDPTEITSAAREIVAGCRDFRALTGRQGDVVLAHPFLLHTASSNATDRLRIISNSSVMLMEPMRFGGPDPTPLERSILDALGVDSLTYAPTGERRKVESARARSWREGRS